MKRLEHYDVFQIPASEIFFDQGFNCRGSFTLQSINDLADSIEANGLQFPLVVQPYEKEPGYKYRLLAGHRRFKALTVSLRWKKIPATIRGGLSEWQSRIVNLTENLERKDLNIMEEAKALQGLYPNGVSLRKAAKELKRPTKWVHIRQKLIKLPVEIQKLVAAGLISAVNIETLAMLESEDDQLQAAQDIAYSKKKYGKTTRLRVRPEYKRKFQLRRTKAQISRMITHLFAVNCSGLPTRLLAWSAGQLTDSEIEEDIKNESGYSKPRSHFYYPED